MFDDLLPLEPQVSETARVGVHSILRSGPMYSVPALHILPWRESALSILFSTVYFISSALVQYIFG